MFYFGVQICNVVCYTLYIIIMWRHHTVSQSPAGLLLCKLESNDTLNEPHLNARNLVQVYECLSCEYDYLSGLIMTFRNYIFERQGDGMSWINAQSFRKHFKKQIEI